MPEIQAAYRVTQERTLVGHSLAGLFVLDVFLKAPESFEHYIAIDPALFWGDHYLVKQIKNWHASAKGPAISVYIAQGNSPLSDYEDHSLKGSHEMAIREFRRQLEARKGSQVRTGFDLFGSETHRSVVLPALWRGLMFTFAGPTPRR